MAGPMAYTYDAAHHCEGCAAERFGWDADGFITGEDGEGNPVRALYGWEEWHEPSIAGVQVLSCDTCGGELDRIEVTDAD